MVCKFTYKGHTFDNEAQLNDYLIEKKKFETTLGDVVFSKRSRFLRALQILKDANEKAESMKAAFDEAIRNAEDTDTGIVLRARPPYIGVTKFLDGRRNSEGILYYPEFIDENYWADRLSKWTTAPTGDDTLDNHFTDSELKLLVDGKTHEELIANYVAKYHNPDGTPKMLSREEANNLKKLLLKKWSVMNTTGTAMHFVLQQYFGKTTIVRNGESVEVNVRDLTNTATHDDNNNIPSIKEFIRQKIETDLRTQMGRKYRDDLVPDFLLEQLLTYGELLQQHIKDTIGDNDLEFYPEFKITGKIAQIGNGPDTLMGIIDLLVLDSGGHFHIFDYKSSDKTYSEYSSAKKRAFYYQQATYARLLRQHGLAYRDSLIRILPLTLKDFEAVDKELALSDPENAEFTYTSLEFPPNISVDIKGEIFKTGPTGEVRIMNNIDEFLPETRIKDATTEGLQEFVTQMMAKWFPEYSYRKSRTDEEIDKELEDGGGFNKDENGRYHFKLPGSYGKELAADSIEELREKVKISYKRAENNRERMATTVSQALKWAIKNKSQDLNEVLANIDTKVIDDPTAFQGWFKNYLLKYCNEDWEVVDNEGAKHFGIILLRNKNTEQLDVIKTTSAYLKYNRHIGGKDRSSLIGAFANDLQEKANNSSLMLEGVNGNIEMIETMLILNQLPTLFDGEYASAVVGNIQVINPFRGTGLSATNEELMYSYKRLKSYQDILGTDNIASGVVKFAKKWDLAKNDFINAMETSEGISRAFRIKNKSEYSFESAKSELDRVVEPSIDAKIRIVNNIIKDLEKAYHINQLTTNMLKQESADTPAYRLYFEMLQTLAALKGINFRQQLKESDNITELHSFKGILTKGLTGIYIDNPGNLSSETLNTITKLVTLAYLNIRVEMQLPAAKLRSLQEKLKKEKNFGYVTSGIRNETELFKNMIKQTSDGDLVFVNPNTLYGTEKEYLQYVMRLINHNRYPKLTDELLDEMERNEDIRYYRVPLARATFQSRTYYKGMFDGLKERLKSFNPKTALAELRAKAEGIFDESDNSYEKAENLFQMNTLFDRGEPDDSNHSVDDRLQYIKDKGEAFFEHNLEVLALKHTFSYTTKKHIDEVMPTIKSAMAFLIAEGATQNINFENDVRYLENYIKARIKNLPIDDPVFGGTEESKGVVAMSGKIREVASFMALAFSPVQGIYQLIQGLWQDISLKIRKPDGTQAFTFKNMLSAAKEVYAEMFHYSDEPTKCQLINELYGINDMDMNLYAERLKTDKHGFWNISEIAMKFTSRPDFYNRMTIIVAQMKEQGVWDALEVKDGVLVYNPKKDARLSAYYNGDKTNPDYARLEGLYYAMAQQAVREGMRNTDGTLFQIGQELPMPYTNQEMEGMKSLCDLIYGYYSHEKKSMIHATFLGAFFMQMRTYWSGKKNQYLAPGGVKLLGRWEQMTDNEGRGYYYQINEDGTINHDLPPVTEDQLTGNIKIPFMLWKGRWQEGIILTLAQIMRNSSVYNPVSWISGYNKLMENASPEMRLVYRNNVYLFIYDILALLIVGGLIGSLLFGNLDKELQKQAKESRKFSDALLATGVHIMALSITNSASDFNWINTIGGPMVSWSPFAGEFGGRFVKNWYNVAMGDPTFIDGVRNSFSAAKQMTPMMDLLEYNTYG